MPFIPTEPQNGEIVDADQLRGQLNALNDGITVEKTRLDGASAALDWSNGAPKLPQYTTIAAPVVGNLAYDYANEALVVYGHGEWIQLS